MAAGFTVGDESLVRMADPPNQLKVRKIAPTLWGFVTLSSAIKTGFFGHV